MTAHKNARPDLEMALHTITHPAKTAHGQESAKQYEEKKEFHVTRLDDGTFHHVRHDGNDRKEGSAADLDSVHEALHQHFQEEEREKGE